MGQLTINIPEELAKQLEDASKRTGVKPEDLMLLSLEEKLATLDSDFAHAMKRVLQKNEDLYRRLAQ